MKGQPPSGALPASEELVSPRLEPPPWFRRGRFATPRAIVRLAKMGARAMRSLPIERKMEERWENNDVKLDKSAGGGE